MQLRFLGHSGIQLNSVSFNLVIDPFLTGNPTATVKTESLSPQHIILAHAHGDHSADVEPLAKRTGALIISNAEIAGYYGTKGLKAHGMNTGGSFTFPFGKLTFTPAWHSS